MKTLATLLFLITLSSAAAAQSSDAFSEQLQTTLNNYYQDYKDTEYFSGAELSVYIPGQDIRNVCTGTVSHELNSKKVTPNTLFQIGSITKSFTAVVLLQLEKENQLHMHDKLSAWLPDYKKWSSATLTSLLNMTSGFPNYSDSPLWNAQAFYNPTHVWTSEELVAFSYPPSIYSPPLKTNYFYTNTSYILAEMIIKKITHQPFQEVLNQRTIQAAALKNTFYSSTVLDEAINIRMARGYSFNPYDNTAAVGKALADVKNVSWAAAAGGVVANTEDIIKWVKALFVDNTLLDAAQKQALTQLVSTTTGKPIHNVSEKDKHGFGLGVSQGYDKNLFGAYWYYEGKTLGFRSLYLYVPCNGVIISALLNSATNSENDHISELIKNVFKLTLKQHPSLICKK